MNEINQLQLQKDQLLTQKYKLVDEKYKIVETLTMMQDYNSELDDTYLKDYETTVTTGRIRKKTKIIIKSVYFKTHDYYSYCVLGQFEFSRFSIKLRKPETVLLDIAGDNITYIKKGDWFEEFLEYIYRVQVLLTEILRKDVITLEQEIEELQV